MPYVRDGQPGDICWECGDLTRPMVRLVPDGPSGIYTPWCVLCLVERVDRATGWRMASNVRQALLVGDAGERFHHPDRFPKSRKKGRREALLDSRAARATGIPGMVQSEPDPSEKGDW